MVDIDAIYRDARRYSPSVDATEDIAQTACLIALERPWRTNRRWLMHDAIRLVLGRFAWSRSSRPINTTPIEHPEWIASHYASPLELWDRWQDELSEDQADEWRVLPAAERDKRVAESMRALGTSEVMR